MPGFTPTYAWKYPKPGEVPDVPADMRALAVAIDTDLARVESTVLSALEARVAALEAAVAATRWRLISSGTRGAGNFLLTVPAGYSRLRLTLTGDVDATCQINVQVNDDGTVGNHVYGWVPIQSNGALGTPLHSGTTGGAWRVAEWGTVESNTSVVDIFPTDGTANPAYQAYSHRDSTTDTAHTMQVAAGKYTGDVVVSSMEVIADGAADFVDVTWWLEGWLA
jgi:hypothetical protein